MPAARLDRLAEHLRRAESRLAASGAALEQMRGEARSWKTKAEDAQERLKEAVSRAKELERAASDLQREIKRRDAAMEKDAARYAQRVAGVEALPERLAAADRELVAVRDLLMAVETKLEILEAAANALDVRTRAAIAPADSTTTTPA